MTGFSHNAYGWWCPSCGDRIARASTEESSLPDNCYCCGFPDAEQVARYHCDADDGDEEDLFPFDCGLMPDGTCLLAGTEECDWECPNS